MSSRAKSGLGGVVSSRRHPPFERRPFEPLKEDTLSEDLPTSTATVTTTTTRDTDDESPFDTMIISNDETVVVGGIDETTKTTHVLAKSRLLSSSLAFCQGVVALSATFVLSGTRVRTGWAHTYGAGMTIACGVEGLAHVASRAANRLTVPLDVLAFVVCVASYAGVAGLATNTEDDRHGVPVDAIETATCLFALAWGLMTARIAASTVEREAKNECTFELRLVEEQHAPRV